MMIDTVTVPAVALITTPFALLLAWILVYCSSTRQQQSSISTEEAFQSQIKVCPNPNCIRCQRYREIQQSAQRRLPHILRHNLSGGIKQKSSSTSQDATQVRPVRDHLYFDNEEFQRVIDGVTIQPPRPASLNPKSINIITYSSFSKIISWIQNLCSKSQSYNQQRNQSISPARGQYPTVLLLPNLKVQPIITNLHSNTIQSIQTSTNTQIFLNEYIKSQLHGSWQINDSPSSSTSPWEVLYLMNQGQWIESNVDACPQTIQILKQCLGNGKEEGEPGIWMEGCIFGNIFFSVLYPGTVVEPHCGPTNIRHRLHFPLVVPKVINQKERRQEIQPVSHETNEVIGPFLTVMGKKYVWKEGQCFVFDDSLVHAAEFKQDYDYHDGEKNVMNDSNKNAIPPMWQDGNDVRVVLVVDLWHSDLSSLEKELLLQLYPSMPMSSATKTS